MVAVSHPNLIHPAHTFPRPTKLHARRPLFSWTVTASLAWCTRRRRITSVAIAMPVIKTSPVRQTLRTRVLNSNLPSPWCYWAVGRARPDFFVLEILKELSDGVGRGGGEVRVRGSGIGHRLHSPLHLPYGRQPLPLRASHTVSTFTSLVLNAHLSVTFCRWRWWNVVSCCVSLPSLQN